MKLLPGVLIADDHAIIVDGLRAILGGHARVLGTYADGQALLEATALLNPDVVVTDISMPRLSGFDYLRAVQAARLPTRVIMLSMYGTEAIVANALDAGAKGYLPKHAAGEELLDALNAVLAERVYVSPLLKSMSRSATPTSVPADPVVLSKRQREVLQRVAAGKRMKEIAAELRLSRRTVEMHKYGMMRVLGVKTTAELIKYFMKHESLALPLLSPDKPE